jgi:hypothetical protein
MPEEGNVAPGAWRLLSQASRLAFDARQLTLAALGLLLLELGWKGLDRLIGSSNVTPQVIHDLPRLELNRTSDLLELVREAAVAVALPYGTLSRPFLSLFDPKADASQWAHAGLAGLWAIVVWTVIGAAITRLALLRVTSPIGEGIGFTTALGFAFRRTFSLVTAPLTPLVGVVVIALFCAVFGLLYRLPGQSGAIMAGLLGFLPLLAGLFLGIVLIGLALGWPFMVATVAAEAEDAFDALSRSYQYVYQRPLQFARYVGLAWAGGILGVLVLALFVQVILSLAYWAVALGASDALLSSQWEAPSGTITTAMAPRLHRFWLAAVRLVSFGWVYSYFWTATAITYLLLRRDVDGSEWDDIDRLEPWDEASAFMPVEEPARPAPSQLPDEVP